MTIDRPEKRNALSLALIRSLRDGLLDAEAAGQVRGVLISGAGPSFSAGVDLDEFAGASPESVRVLIESLRDLCATARNLPKPVACAIRGHCLGGALEFCLACDFRVCSPSARFGMPEVVIGIPSVIDAALFRHYIGLGRAKEMLLTGDLVAAEDALAWGLVNRMVDEEALNETAVELLEHAARHAPSAIRTQKELIEDWMNRGLQESIEASVPALVDAFRDGAPQRTAAAMLDKRRP